jgi:hypothetical protein
MWTAFLCGALIDALQVVDVAAKDLLVSRFPNISLLEQNFDTPLEGIPNRDSLSYGPSYDLPADIRTLLRGTLRY